MPEICGSQPDLLTDRQAKTPPVGLWPLQISKARLRSPLWRAFLWGERKKSSERTLHQTLQATLFLAPGSTKPSGAERAERGSRREIQGPTQTQYLGRTVACAKQERAAAFTLLLHRLAPNRKWSVDPPETIHFWKGSGTDQDM